VLCDDALKIVFAGNLEQRLLEDPIRVVEGLATARDRQRLELRQWHNPSILQLAK
jgi:hypothetical protein